VGFGHGQCDAVGDRITIGAAHRNAAFAFAAATFAFAFAASFAFAAAFAFAFAATFASLARRNRRSAGAFTALAASLSTSLAAASRQHPASERRAEAELSPEFQFAVHGVVSILHPAGIWPPRFMTELIIVRKSNFLPQQP